MATTWTSPSVSVLSRHVLMPAAPLILLEEEYIPTPYQKAFTGKVTTLKSNGQDMKGTIQNAIKQYDVVILDGADGEFIVSSNIGITASNKTIIGINNAIISTKWYVTDEIKKALNDAGVPNMSTSGGGGKPSQRTVCL